MFTGLVLGMGRVRDVEARSGGRRMWIETDLVAGARAGDSIAVDGCCLTMAALEPGAFAADVVPETLRRTVLGDYAPGRKMNLELPLRPDQPLGGHFVQGHVDGVGEVEWMRDEGEGKRLSVRVPDALARYVAEKGSIAIDGVSLTVAACSGARCEIALVPHTLEMTVASGYAPGRRVNIEVDLVARYVARLLEETGALGGRS